MRGPFHTLNDIMSDPGGEVNSKVKDLSPQAGERMMGGSL
jgi:hypothetical protein